VNASRGDSGLIVSDPQSELLNSFRAFIKAAEDGASIPPVDEHDLKALHELCVDRAKRYCGKDGVISIEMTARACAPTANLPAVWFRHTQLRSLYRKGLLAEWQHGAVLDDVVFSVASNIPMNGTHLDEEDFLRYLRSSDRV
jgi:hypothetical protein